MIDVGFPGSHVKSIRADDLLTTVAILTIIRKQEGSFQLAAIRRIGYSNRSLTEYMDIILPFIYVSRYLRELALVEDQSDSSSRKQFVKEALQRKHFISS